MGIGDGCERAKMAGEEQERGRCRLEASGSDLFHIWPSLVWPGSARLGFILRTQSDFPVVGFNLVISCNREPKQTKHNNKQVMMILQTGGGDWYLWSKCQQLHNKPAPGWVSSPLSHSHSGCSFVLLLNNHTLVTNTHTHTSVINSLLIIHTVSFFFPLMSDQTWKCTFMIAAT